MSKKTRLGEALQRLRELARLSQAQLAGRLPFTPSRMSRLESGELALDRAEAAQIADAIGTPEAKEFARFLSWNWRVLEPPSFDHPSLKPLWQAEQALQRLDDLKDDPELKNAFLKQVESCESAIGRTAHFLESAEHPVAFIGSPGVGKTTAICAVTKELRDWTEKDLNRQMALQTGSGRITICEVHVRGGAVYGIAIEPCSDEELRYHVSDFCEHLINQTDKRTGKDAMDGSGISAEMERTLRNMTGLTVKRANGPDGKVRREDPALALVEQYPDKDELLVEILVRLNVARRSRTSIIYPRAMSVPPMKWVSKTFAEINFGRHPEVSLPRRIEVSVPGNVIGSSELDVRLIDTRGIDEPSAPRRDLQSYLDDERAIIVLCSDFAGAPSAAIQAVIERAKEGGLRKAIVSRGLLLVLPKDGEEQAVLSESTGEPVANAHEGRDIRLDQIRTTTLADLRVRDLPIEFLNVRSRKDCDRICEGIRSKILQLRGAAADQIRSLAKTVDRLIENKADEQARAVFAQATRPLRTWLESNQELAGEMNRVDMALAEEIDSLRYAASLRASVNRRGNWHNFDYWHGLGFGARRDVVARSKEQITKLQGIVENVLADSDLSESHDFLHHFESQIEDATGSFFVDVQQVAETAFSEQLRGDHEYWSQCQGRWGGGPGYKNDIRSWTNKWFRQETQASRHEFIKAETQQRWKQMIDNLSQQLESPAAIVPLSSRG